MKGEQYMFSTKINERIDTIMYKTRTSLGPLLFKVFTCTLSIILPNPQHSLAHRKKYIGDTHAYINPKKTDYVMTKLNCFHNQIQLTYTISAFCFLNIQTRKVNYEKLQTTAFIKWKRETLKNLKERFILICSNHYLSQKELDY